MPATDPHSVIPSPPARNARAVERRRAGPLPDTDTPPERIHRRPLRVLVVEDNPFDARLVREYLSESTPRYEITQATTMRRAEALVSRQSFDAVLLDLTLPDADRLEALHQLRSAAPSVALVVLSGTPNHELGLRALHCGAQDFLRKAQVDPRSLDAALRRACDRKLAEQRLVYLAHYDHLTGLANRTTFEARTQIALRNADATLGQRVALMMIDLDHFKGVNDGYGHDVGDAVLQEVAGRLSSASRRGDLVARVGGDEFAVLIAGITDDSALPRMAERFNGRVAEPLVIDGLQLSLTCSIGVAVAIGAPARTVKALTKTADIAMYRVKASGRAGYDLLHHSERTPAAGAETEALAQALTDNDFRLLYQPQIDLATDTVIGYEALLRWQQRNGRLVAPGDFIGRLESSGLIVDVGRWALHSACNQLRDAMRGGSGPVRVAVNLSARQFDDGTLVETVRRAVTEAGVPFSGLELEITESLLLRDSQDVYDTLEALRGFGVRIAIDDFGTGYSSLSYLHRVPADVLKLDRSLVSGLGHGERADTIASAMITLGQNLGLEVVAEGVEDERQAAFLREAGCPLAQGYLFARPAPWPGFASA